MFVFLEVKNHLRIKENIELHDEECGGTHCIRSLKTSIPILEKTSQCHNNTKKHPYYTCGSYDIHFEQKIYKNHDIVLYKNDEPVVIIPFKMPMSNYSQNSRNIHDNSYGECGLTNSECAIKSWGCLVSPFSILMTEYPYYNKSHSKFEKIESIYGGTRNGTLSYLKRYEDTQNRAKLTLKHEVNYGIFLMNSTKRITKLLGTMVLKESLARKVSNGKLKADANDTGLLEKSDQIECGSVNINNWLNNIRLHLDMVEQK